MSSSDEFDYVIVGGGVAGLTLASRLSKLIPDASIMVVEAGSDPSVNPNVMHISGYHLLQPSPQAWTLPVQANPHLNDRASTVYVGKGLSGSAAINGSAWTRGPASDYDLWARLVGDNGWAYEAMLPYFKLTENDQNPDATPGHHGHSEHVRVQPVKSEHPSRHYPLRDSIQEMYAEAGVPYNPDPNDGFPKGLCENVECWQQGKRQLPLHFLDLSRVTLRPNATVRRVTIAGSPLRATGIELVDGTVLLARREVILSAGVYHTPQVLLLSGLGPAAHLTDHSIPVTLDNPAVGSTLIDHVAMSTTFRLKDAVAAQGAAIPHPKFMSNLSFINGWPLDFLYFNSLPPAALRSLADLIPRPTDREFVCREDAVHFESAALYLALPRRYSGIDPPTDGAYLTLMMMLLAPTSRGTVRLRSADAEEQPLINPNYNATTSDRYVFRNAVRNACSIFTSTPTGQSTIDCEVPPEGFKPILPETSDEDIDARIRQFATSMEHPLGSCMMAKTPGYEDAENGGVVDSRCRVFGVEGLRIVDASVLPIPITAHTQAVTYALAERAAAIIAESYQEVISK